jgi:hypothetical protein
MSTVPIRHARPEAPRAGWFRRPLRAVPTPPLPQEAVVAPVTPLRVTPAPVRISVIGTRTSPTDIPPPVPTSHAPRARHALPYDPSSDVDPDDPDLGDVGDTEPACAQEPEVDALTPEYDRLVGGALATLDTPVFAATVAATTDQTQETA